VEDTKLLLRLKNADPAALESIIDRYGAYIQTIVRNRAQDMLPAQDVEEIASDVFVALWKNAQQISPGHLRGWLAATARNRTVDFLRKIKIDVPLEEDYFITDDAIWEKIDADTLAKIVQHALDVLSVEDREIFLRYYDLCQPIREIAGKFKLTESAVKMRLYRGRQTMKNELKKGGISIEDYIS